jgi:hypothetical protein
MFRWRAKLIPAVNPYEKYLLSEPVPLFRTFSGMITNQRPQQVGTVNNVYVREATVWAEGFAWSDVSALYPSIDTHIRYIDLHAHPDSTPGRFTEFTEFTL